jgi:hypothetical protein
MIDVQKVMVQSQAILIDDETEPVVLALEGRSARLAVVSDDAPDLVLSGPGSGKSAIGELVLHLLRQAVYVPVDHAAVLIGTAPVAIKSLIRRGVLAAITREDQVYVSLQSVLDFRDQQETGREGGLAEMVRVSEDAGLYDAELDTP